MRSTVRKSEVGGGKKILYREQTGACIYAWLLAGYAGHGCGSIKIEAFEHISAWGCKQCFGYISFSAGIPVIVCFDQEKLFQQAACKFIVGQGMPQWAQRFSYQLPCFRCGGKLCACFAGACKDGVCCYASFIQADFYPGQVSIGGFVECNVAYGSCEFNNTFLSCLLLCI